MINNNKIILSDSGEDKEYDIILTFETKENDNYYIVYTDNKLDEDGFIKNYAGIYDKSGNEDKLLPVTEEEDWELIDFLLKKIEKEDN